MSAPTNKDTHSRPKGEAESGDQVGELLRIVGPRQPAPEPRRERVKAAVRDVWLEEVGQRKDRKDRQSRAWKRRGLAFGGLAFGGMALAALMLLTVGLRYWNAKMVDPPGQRATVATVDWAPIEAAVFTLGQPLHAGDEITTTDHRLALRLASGSSLRLDAKTRLRIDSATSLTLEAGTIYIDSGVSPNDVAAIEVHTAFGIARDIGTQFEVRVTDTDLRLRVREGTVLLDDFSLDDSHQAEAGDELTVDGDGVTRSPVTPHGESWDWIHDAAPTWDPGRPHPGRDSPVDFAPNRSRGALPGSGDHRSQATHPLPRLHANPEARRRRRRFSCPPSD